MPLRHIRPRLAVAMLVTGLLAGAGYAVVAHLLDDDVAEQITASRENQDGLICLAGKVATGLTVVIPPEEAPPEVDELRELLPLLDVDAACDRFTVAVQERLNEEATQDATDAARALLDGLEVPQEAQAAP